jgi:hypothetical protein
VSRSTVRHAIADFLAAGVPAIPGLQQVFKAMPTLIDGALFNLIADGGSGAVAWLHLAISDETRWTTPGPTPAIGMSGTKGVHYDVTVMVAYQYLLPSASTDPTVMPDDWVDSEDAILQGIKSRLQSDATCGTSGPGGSGVIWSAGQNPNGLTISPDEPVLEDGKVISWHEIGFRVTEVVQA